MELTIKDQVNNALMFLEQNKNENFVVLSSETFNINTFAESNNIYQYCKNNKIHVFWIPFNPIVIIGRTQKIINEIRKNLLDTDEITKHTDMKYVKNIDVYENGISVEYSKLIKWCPFDK